MKFVRVATLLLPLVVIAGCGGSATPPGDRTMQTYFDGIATQTVGSLREAVAAAEPGSPAAAYATYLLASSRAASDGGDPVDQQVQRAERTAKGYRFCQRSGSDKTCFEYADIVRSGDKVLDFTVNGRPIKDRLAVGSAPPTAFRGIDAKAQFVAAYETTASDSLLVAVRITSGAGTSIGGVRASYQAAGGARVPSAKDFGPAKMRPGSTTNHLFLFPRAPLGGRVTLSATDEGTGGTGTVTLPVR